MKYIVCIFWRNKDTISAESDWANQINTIDQKNMLSDGSKPHLTLTIHYQKKTCSCENLNGCK